MERRKFIKNSSLAAASVTGIATAFSKIADNENQLQTDKEKVNFTRDGLDLTVREYANLLTQIDVKDKIEPDYYSNGGVVEELEKRMAKILGKESAVFMPTGTLANHIAIRKLAGEKRKVIVQAESHIYRDSGDCANTLSGLNLIPLAQGRKDYNLSEVEEVVRRTAANRVNAEIGVISIESPVRRHNNQMFDFNEMQKISEFARNKEIKMHLDGARLFNACVHLDKTAAEISGLFDTVYVSLYKNFNAASGAILAGSKEFTKDLFHTRRMFGGGMPQVWPFAAVALNYLDGFIESYQKSQERADAFFNLIQKNGKVKVAKLPNGTNVVKLNVAGISPEKLKDTMEKQNIYIPVGNKETGDIFIKINPSILRKSVEKLAESFNRAIK
jgi:threonine aldolase